MDKEIKRPWQGALQGVLDYISFVVILGSIISIVIAIFNEHKLALFSILIIPLVLLAFLCFAMGKGFYKGKKWVVVVSMVLYTFAIIVSFIDFHFLSIVVQIFLLWTCTVCLKHPFYNQKKSKKSQLEDSVPV